jgi:hypothetical protein
MIRAMGGDTMTKISKGGLAALILLATFLFASATPAAGISGGFRAGFTDDPDSFFFGGHAAIDPFPVPLRIEPSLQLGFGDFGGGYDFFTLRFDANFKYRFGIPPEKAFKIYPILGMAIYYWNVTDDRCAGDCDGTEAGLNLGFGFEIYGFMVDFTFGLDDDLPDFTFLVGYTF